MIVAGSASPLLLASAGGYNLTRSLRFRSSASAYLNRTPASAGNQKTWTFSAWVKRGQLGSTQIIAQAGTGGTNFTYIALFNSSDQLVILDSTVSGVSSARTSSAVFRDPSAWYHIVVNLDATNSVCNGFVNGVAQTFTGTQPSNQNWAVNSTIEHRIGRAWGSNTSYLDGYIAEVNFIDGQALTPSSFGQNNAQTGVWQPKRYTGTYGTNGFYLPFTNNSTTTTLGNDFSGNGNNWTTNNISLTSGATYDSMTDVPTLTSATTANFATFNPLYRFLGTPTLSNANLQLTGSNITCASTMAFPTTGKWYAEFSPISSGYVAIGIANSQPTKTQYISYSTDGLRNTPSGSVSYGATYTTNDIIGVAVDCDSSQVTFYKNNVSQGALAFSLSSLSSSDLIFDFYVSSTAGSGINGNFGQRPFAYTPPTGFVALNTFNLPTPTIGATASTQANKYFDATTYTGNGSTQSIVNAGGFQPDLVWAKRRSGLAQSNNLADSVRGVQKMLYSDLTIAESTDVNAITAFNSNGFSTGSSGGTNNNADSYVAWQWNAGGSTVTNTSGSISSQVRANPSAGFSIVTYTGNGSNPATIGHGLGVAPRMVITKSRNGSGLWFVMNQSANSGAGQNGYLVLNQTGAFASDVNAWNNTSPTSSVFTVGSYSNANGTTYVAYCFSEVAGYSRFGSYTGNGSTDGPFVFTGFRPKYILWKNASTTSGWGIRDTTRNPSNVANLELAANTSDAEVAGQGIDILSNGFKLRTADAWYNGNGNTMIFMAFAEFPFRYSLAR